MSSVLQKVPRSNPEGAGAAEGALVLLCAIHCLGTPVPTADASRGGLEAANKALEQRKAALGNTEAQLAAVARRLEKWNQKVRERGMLCLGAGRCHHV